MEESMEGASEKSMLEFLNIFEKNLNYQDHSADMNSINFKKDYLFSRYYDKIYTITLNLIKITNMHNRIKFESIEDSNIKNIEIYKKESDIELASGLLRSSLEIYLELRSLEIGVSKKYSIESLANLVIQFYNYEDFRSILKSAKDFYNCEPLFYKKFTESMKKELDDARNELSSKNIPLLSKISKKYEIVVGDNPEFEKLLFGKGFYNGYRFLSKKIHFSTTSYFTSASDSSMNYLSTSVFIVLEIYRIIFNFLSVEAVSVKKLHKISEYFRTTIKNSENAIDFNRDLSKGDFVLLSCGIAEIVERLKSCVKVKYVFANYLEPDDEDEIPEHFIMKKLALGKIESSKKKIISQEMSNNEFNKYIIKNEKYSEFWMDLYNE